MKIRIIMAFGGAMAALIQVQTSQAALTGSLNGGNSIAIGDKTFSNFDYVASGADENELAADALDLSISAKISGGVYYLDWSGLIAVNNLGGATPLLGDLQLTYTVTANSGLISMIDQSYTPNALPATGQIIIGETVQVPGGAIVANSTLTLSPTDLSDPAPEAGDNLFVNPNQPVLNVTKDILIDADAGQLVGLSDVEQSFHQVAVPEPMTVTILGLGALACFNHLRTKRS